jgi:hypothetical protein
LEGDVATVADNLAPILIDFLRRPVSDHGTVVFVAEAAVIRTAGISPYPEIK